MWTRNLLSGGEERFEKAALETDLTQATYGLVTASAYKETRERLERKRSEELANAAEQEARSREEAEQRKRRKREKQRQKQASKLSFDDDDAADECGGGARTLPCGGSTSSTADSAARQPQA